MCREYTSQLDRRNSRKHPDRRTHDDCPLPNPPPSHETIDDIGILPSELLDSRFILYLEYYGGAMPPLAILV